MGHLDEKIVMTLAKGNTYREGLKKWKNSRLLPVRASGGLTSPETSEEQDASAFPFQNSQS